jgi:DMSO reductase family type II enzyme chaperone
MVEEIMVNSSELSAKRCLVYATFAAAFEYPDSEMVEAVRSGKLAENFKEVITAVDPALAQDADWQALSDAGQTDDDLMVEFTRLFDAGTAGPPCALYGGLYTGARMQIMEELVRFYNFFGLSMSDTPHELPDHITTQLEFLHFLTFRETNLVEQGESVSDCQRAERDFIARHPGRWIPQMRLKMAEQKPAPLRFFSELTRLLEEFLYSEVQKLAAIVGPVPQGEGAVIASNKLL